MKEYMSDHKNRVLIIRDSIFMYILDLLSNLLLVSIYFIKKKATDKTIL